MNSKNSFADLLRNGICENHRLQVQGQLMATGADWCDYAAQAENFAVETHCQELSDTNRNAPFDFGKCRAFYTKLYDEKGE